MGADMKPVLIMSVTWVRGEAAGPKKGRKCVNTTSQTDEDADWVKQANEFKEDNKQVRIINTPLGYDETAEEWKLDAKQDKEHGSVFMLKSMPCS